MSEPTSSTGSVGDAAARAAGQGVTESEVVSWFERLSNWGRWGPDDDLGTMNFVTDERRRASAAEIRHGIAVSCAHDIDTAHRPDMQNRPAPQRFMTGLPRSAADDGYLGSVATEYIGMIYHSFTVTHLDSLSHTYWRGQAYGGRPGDIVASETGAVDLDVTRVAGGIVTRGVLLDVADVNGVPWLEPGTPVFPHDLERVEERQGVEVRTGDAVLLRTGHGAYQRSVGYGDPAVTGQAGWHASCLPWLYEREVAVVGADTAQEARPNEFPNVRVPIHNIGVVAMGLWLLDNCDLEALGAECRRLGQWTFQLTVAPLRIVGGTGSPVNPIAIL